MPAKPIPRGALEVNLGSAFRAAREAANMTLVDLSQRLDCSVNTIRWHEAGARPMRSDMLSMAAQIMDVPAGQLLGEAPAETSGGGDGAA